MIGTNVDLIYSLNEYMLINVYLVVITTCTGMTDGNTAPMTGLHHTLVKLHWRKYIPDDYTSPHVLASPKDTKYYGYEPALISAEKVVVSHKYSSVMQYNCLLCLESKCTDPQYL